MIGNYHKPADFIEIEHNGLSALTYAIVEENNTLVEAMLKRGIDKDLLSKEGGNGRTPLSLAVKRGNERIINMLVAAGADPAIKPSYDGTPMSIINRNIEYYNQAIKNNEDVLRNEEKIKTDLADVNQSNEKNNQKQMSLEDYKISLKESIEDNLKRLNKWKKIREIVESEKSALQESLSSLQKQLEQLKNKLQNLATELTTLKKNLGRKS